MVRLSELCFKQGFSINRLIDVGAGYGIFLDEWRKSFPNTSLLAVEPSASLANECRTKGFEIAEDIVENVIGYDDSADLVTCFEVLEHTYSPLNFLFALKKLARPGGLVFISTLGIDGFDLQMLWEKSTQISPPHHINFISINGFKDLFQRAGLVDIKILTPGQLDVDIVRNLARRDASLLSNNRFLYNLLNDDQKSSEFQKFLSENLLSSHVWILGMKPEK
ncbi:MAG: class I SAM-dependent methyltransferase [Deltaproteobacteria bacterium]|nr:MAG: class I SAM-dependent methyltransferase [Deltaproteobacteria bacterium]